MTINMRSFAGKNLVSYARGGDYAHPGEEEAIELLMSGFEKNQSRMILDVGCGLGGTAKYIQDKGWGKVTGIDIEKESIEYARIKYPDVEFFEADVLDVGNVLLDRKYDLIYLFCSFYSFPKQFEALQAITEHAQNNAVLLIFDLVDYTNGQHRLIELQQKDRITNPIQKTKLSEMLTNIGWGLTKIIDLNEKHVRWYKNFLIQLNNKRHEIINLFGEMAYISAIARYETWLEEISSERLGGAIFQAKKLY